MDNVFILNPSVTRLDLINAIDVRVLQTKSIIASLMACDNQSSYITFEMLHGVLWALNDYLIEIELLHNRLG